MVQIRTPRPLHSAVPELPGATIRVPGPNRAVPRHAPQGRVPADPVTDEFLSTVSHELRAPLSSVAGYLELLRESLHEGSDTDRDHMLDGMSRGVSRIERMIDGLLGLARANTTGVAALGRVDMQPLIDEAIDVLRPGADAKGVSVVPPAVAPGSVVIGDTGLLDSLLLNLLSNAIKFTDDGGTVRVSGAVAGGRFFLQISDTGIGMSPDDLGRLFRPFFRSTTATARRITGSGLGLTIAKRIVDQHHGEIRVLSEPRIGTTVEVTLPLAVEEPVQRKADQALPRVTIFPR